MATENDPIMLLSDDGYIDRVRATDGTVRYIESSRTVAAAAAANTAANSANSAAAAANTATANANTAASAATDTYAAAVACGYYAGRNLADVLGVSDFATLCSTLQTRAKAGNFTGLRLFDYLNVTRTVGSSTYTERYDIVAFDPYYMCGDTEKGHHICFAAHSTIPVYESAWQTTNGQYCYWGSSETNNGNSSTQYPYLASSVYKYLTTVYQQELPSALTNIMLTQRVLLESRYSSSNSSLTDSTGWGWVDIGKLWLASETETYGFPVWGTKGWSQGFDCPLPGLALSTHWHVGVSRAASWLRTVHSGSSTAVCFATTDGGSGYYSARRAWIRPRPCFLVG